MTLSGTIIGRRTFVRLLAGATTVQLVLEACSPAAPAAPTAAAATSAPAPAATTVGSAPAAAAAAGTTPATGAPPASGATPGANKNAAAFPTYLPVTLPTPPDYHSPDPRVTDGFDTYPTNPAKSWNKPAPGHGQHRQHVHRLVLPSPDALRSESHVARGQQTAQCQRADVDGHRRRLSRSRSRRVLADTSNLPDIIHIYNGIGAAPSLPDFFKAQCADLTPYLAGDAAKDYPNLAAIPTYAWENSICAIDGRLYQWPIHRYLPLQGIYKNSDVYDAAFGADYVPRDIDDFTRMLKQVNDPAHNQWAMGNVPTAAFNFGMYGYSAIFGAPNNWSLDSSGKLTKDMETEEFKATIGWMRDT